MLRRLYSWTVDLARTPYALWALTVVAFLESSVFAIPPDVLLIPMIIAAPRRAFQFALVCTLASVAGAALGYVIGWQLYDTIGVRIVSFYGMEGAFDSFQGKFNEYGTWAVLFAGVTPFPFKVITITSGVTGLPFVAFMFWSLIARGLRFFILAVLLWKYGEPIRNFIEKRLGLMFTLFTVLLLGGFYLVRFL